MHLLFVRTTVTTIIITVIKIKPKIRYIILQALGITFTLFSHLTNTRTQKETRSLVLCWFMTTIKGLQRLRLRNERKIQTAVNNNYGNFHHKKSVEHLRENV